MKKIIALFVIMLAFSFNANAQQKKAATANAVAKADTSKAEAAHEAAIKDVTTLGEFVTLTNEQKQKFKSLFEQKHRTLQVENLSEERKTVLAQVVEAQLKSGLNPDQVAKLEQNAELVKILSH